ncbi:MAG: serine/threonine protein kinase [Planctomycetes bacterium]|nr:serine/threonine protein kinase [Planctomycetota bacterium]
MGLDTLLARHLLEQGLVSRENLVRGLEEARRTRNSDEDLRLAWLLLGQGLVSASLLDEAFLQISNEQQTREPRASVQSQAPNRRLGPYLLQGLLGQGGMGAVFEAVHVQTGERVAVKVLAPLADEMDRERFRREALALEIKHPNLVQTRGQGLDGPTPYLALDLLVGGSLQDRLKRGPLPLSDLQPLAADLAAGLEALHAEGILRRDIKPANVLFNEEGRAHLADFGIARLPGASTLTQTGELMGTPAYMAPEQTRASKDLTPAVDVYGLAATLYAAATGRPPFPAAGVIRTLIAVQEELPRSPSSLRAELTDQTCQGLMSGLEKAAQDRPSSANALVEACFGQATPNSGSRSPALILLPALGLLAVVLYVAFGLRVAPSPSPTPALATTSPAKGLGLAELLRLQRWTPEERERVWTLAAALELDQLQEVHKSAPGRPHHARLAAYTELRAGRRGRLRHRGDDPDLTSALCLNRDALDFAVEWNAHVAIGPKRGSISAKKRAPQLLERAKRLSARLPRPLREQVCGTIQTVLARVTAYFTNYVNASVEREEREQFTRDVVSLPGTRESRLRARLFEWHLHGTWASGPDRARSDLYRDLRTSISTFTSTERIVLAELAQLEGTDPEAERLAGLALRHLANRVEVGLARGLWLRLALRRLILASAGSGSPDPEVLSLARKALAEVDPAPEFHEELVARSQVILALLEESREACRRALQTYRGQLSPRVPNRAENEVTLQVLTLAVELARGEVSRGEERLSTLLANPKPELLPAEIFALAAHLEALGRRDPGERLEAYRVALKSNRRRVGLPWYRPGVVEAAVEGSAWSPDLSD